MSPRIAVVKHGFSTDDCSPGRGTSREGSGKKHVGVGGVFVSEELDP